MTTGVHSAPALKTSLAFSLHREADLDLSQTLTGPVLCPLLWAEILSQRRTGPTRESGVLGLF